MTELFEQLEEPGITGVVSEARANKIRELFLTLLKIKSPKSFMILLVYHIVIITYAYNLSVYQNFITVTF